MQPNINPNNPRPPRNNDGPKRGNKPQGAKNVPPIVGSLTTSRGQAVRAQRRSQADAQRIANQYQPAEAGKPIRANLLDDSPRLKIIGLGGMDGGGSKNMILVEYVNDAVILDAGNDLGVDLPGINYGIADTTYLESIAQVPANQGAGESCHDRKGQQKYGGTGRVGGEDQEHRGRTCAGQRLGDHSQQQGQAAGGRC